MIYSIRRIKIGKKEHECAMCGFHLLVGEEKIEMFGCAHRDEKPYTIYVHESCMSEDARYMLAEKEDNKIVGYVMF